MKIKLEVLPIPSIGVAVSIIAPTAGVCTYSMALRLAAPRTTLTVCVRLGFLKSK